MNDGGNEASVQTAGEIATAGGEAPVETAAEIAMGGGEAPVDAAGDIAVAGGDDAPASAIGGGDLVAVAAPVRRRLSPAAAALAACGAMAAVGSSFAVLDGLHGYPAAGGQSMRYAVGALLLVAAARGSLARPTKRQLARIALLSATGLAAFNLLVLAAESSMDPGSVGVVVATVPVLLALAGPLQNGDKPRLRVVLAGAIVAAGAAAVQGLGGDVSAAGLAAALGALACEAAFSLLAAPLLQPLGTITVSAYAVAIAVPMLAALALVTTGYQVPTLKQAASLAWLASVVTALAFVLWYSAVNALGVERAGLFAGVLPVAALLCAAALGDSRLTPGRVAGVLAVAAGIAVGLRASRSPTRT